MTGGPPAPSPGSRLLTVVMVLAVVCAVLVVAGNASGYRTLVEQSGSMEPVLSPGDLLLTRERPVRELRSGQVVSFRDATRGGLLVTHRVTSVTPGGGRIEVRTRGDASSTSETWEAGPDEPVHVLVGSAPTLATLVGRPVLRGLGAAGLGIAALLLLLAAVRRSA